MRSWAKTHQVDFHTRRLALEPGAGLEERARDARYAALKELAQTAGLSVIATAHTGSDQAETVLMRLLRGTALRGAAGILAERADGVIRPLLFATRAQTVQYVTEAGVPFIRDPMNDDPTYLRVRVRQQLMPVVEGLAGPGVVARLTHFAQLAQEDDAFLQAEAAVALERVRVPDGLDLYAVRSLVLPVRRRVLARWLVEHHVPLDAHHLDDVLAALSEGRTATLPHDRLLIVARQAVRVAWAPPRLHGSSSGDDGRS